MFPLSKLRAWLPTLAFALGACSDAPSTIVAPPSVASRSNGVVTEPTTGPWLRIVEGETGPGSQFGLYIPRNWNGGAVYYSHGFRDAASPVDLRDQDSLYATRDQFGTMGYAVAYSSYSENGFVVKDGAQRTHQLRGLLTSELGKAPTRSYLIGHSLGGGIALSLAERYPDQYDGALLMCGMVGGSLIETQYLGHVRALADVFFPGRFPGNVEWVPPGTVITLPQVVGAVQSNPAGLFAIASMQQTPLPGVPIGNVTDPTSPAFQTLVGSLYGALSFHARGINNIVDLVPGDSPFDNAGTTYALSANPWLPAPVLAPAAAYANASVTRYAADVQATNYLERYFSPSGALAMPVLTIHNTWDPAVPLFHEVELAARASAAGAAGNLLQRRVNSFGHCAIPAATIVQGFQDLVQWEASGNKPAN
ncbi:MAG TPA: alpha/beta hydrolase-fold protein [Gemmatimonadaceae bacterium]|nr:alpha/beta hydrolase-fold protein [Gemmatimonadaceae bacterium]